MKDRLWDTELDTEHKKAIIEKLKGELGKLLAASHSHESKDLINFLQRNTANPEGSWQKIIEYTKKKGNRSKSLYKKLEKLILPDLSIVLARAELEKLSALHISKYFRDESERDKLLECFKNASPSREYESKASRELWRTIKNQNENPTVRLYLIETYLSNSANKHRTLYKDIEEYMSTAWKLLAIDSINANKHDEGLERLGKCTDKTPDYFALLGECYKGKNNYQLAYENFFLAYLKSTTRKDKELYAIKASECLPNLIKDVKNIPYLKALATGTRGDYARKLIGKSSRLFAVGNLAGALVAAKSVALAPLALPTLLVTPVAAAIGATRGAIQAKTRKILSRHEQVALIGQLHEVATLPEPKQLELIIRVIDKYITTKSKLMSSKESKALFSILKDSQKNTNEKMDALLSYMLQISKSGLFKNNGKTLFTVIAEACTQPEVTMERHHSKKL